MRLLLVLAGVGQLALALGSLAIPRVLGWREDTAKLRNLTRQVFWTYAGYIWATNVVFGLVSALASGWLLDTAPLARAVSAYIALYLDRARDHPAPSRASCTRWRSACRCARATACRCSTS